MSGVGSRPVQLTVDQSYLDEFLTLRDCPARIIVEDGGIIRLKLSESLSRGRYGSTPDKVSGLWRVGGEGFQVRSYSVRIECSEDVRSLIDAYARLLERALGEIWSRIVWCERVIKVKRPIPIPVSDKKENSTDDTDGQLSL